MIDKFLNSKGLKRIVTALMVATVFIGAICITYPATRKSDTIRFLGTNAASATKAASAAFTTFAEGGITTLLSTPNVTSDFKKLSGMLTRISTENKYGAMYMVYRGVGGKYYTLLDSRYRDTGTAGTDYFAPGGNFSDEVFQRIKGNMNRIYDKKIRSEFDTAVYLNQKNEKVVVSYSGVYSRDGDVLGILVTETPAENTDFSSFGIINFNIIAILCIILFGILVAILVLMKKWRLARADKATAKADRMAEAEAAKAVEKAVENSQEPAEPAKPSAPLLEESPQVPETTPPEDKI